MPNPLFIIAFVTGSAFYLPQGIARLGDRIQPGVSVYTWRNSSIKYTPPFSGYMTQYSCTVMSVDRLRFVNGALDMSVRLREPLLCGGLPMVVVNTRFTNKSSRLVLKTPSGLEARVNGTTLGVSLDKAGRGLVGVREGVVTAASPINEVLIPSGYFSQETNDGRWTEPKRIPTADLEIKSAVGNKVLVRSKGVILLRDEVNNEIILDEGYAWVESPTKLKIVDYSGRESTVTIPLRKN